VSITASYQLIYI